MIATVDAKAPAAMTRSVRWRRTAVNPSSAALRRVRRCTAPAGMTGSKAKKIAATAKVAASARTNGTAPSDGSSRTPMAGETSIAPPLRLMYTRLRVWRSWPVASLAMTAAVSGCQDPPTNWDSPART